MQEPQAWCGDGSLLWFLSNVLPCQWLSFVRPCLRGKQGPPLLLLEVLTSRLTYLSLLLVAVFITRQQSSHLPDMVLSLLG